ncbi:phosphatase PAP2 family protein [Frigoriflavimonas asaccharolytica]|uniref:Undecaprenyl-diphosphatase n=1 Tax=Frigoriflavimonas asaccharolytica TaxID=2735899 RepID=A0A8J8GAN8_9FLAO|nr:phosphatase PAP2 family protein [Frigoriflavimonas asaccharolytica]NRS94026.1 undecaprenyl-diphosphatase [Frigoriflavimonas asaccharolytica]
MKIIQFLKKYYKNASAYLLGAIVFFAISLFTFIGITDEIVLEKETGFDETIFLFFKNFIVHQRLNQVVNTITDFSSPKLMMYLFPIIVVSFFLFKLKRESIFLLISGSGSLLLLSAFKRIFERARPPYPLLYPENGFSFPSGHATFSFVFYGSLAYLVWVARFPKYLKILMMTFLILLSFAIGISRIYLRVHYPSDVIAGFALGYSWLFLIIFIFKNKFPLKQ